MPHLDTFESAFRAADKPVYTHTHVAIPRFLIVTDLSDAEADPLITDVLRFLSVLGDPLEWQHIGRENFASVGSLLEQVEQVAPDLIISYRHLHSQAWRWPHSLGEYIDVLTQVTDIPVLVLPHPSSDRVLSHAFRNTDRVMAITDRLIQDAKLVDYAVRLTQTGGSCWLTHVESRRQFEHFLSAVGKVPEIETGDVAQLVEAQLLKEPRDYVDSCREEIDVHKIDVTIEGIVVMGDRVQEYRRLVEDLQIDLLVMNTMDEDQLAMHGGAYPLAVELRGIPLLML